MVIGTCGFGSTGSSAVSDYLKEFDNNCTLDKAEFFIVYCPDGLVDLEFHLMHPHSRVAESDCALERFKYMVVKDHGRYLSKKMGITLKELDDMTSEFIDKLTQVSWLGYQNYTNSFIKENIGGRLLYYRVFPFFQKHFNKNFTGYPLTPTRVSVRPDNFYDEAKAFIRNMLVRMGANYEKNIVLDQPFPGNNPAVCFPFYDDPYAIVVDRDPRDNYVFAKTKLKGNINGFMPTEDVHEFIKYYRALRDGQAYKETNDRILRIQFEEMVYDYDIATEKIREFLRLPKNPRPKSIFDPALSVANTQTVKRFPQFSDEVAVIEKELPEYLFDFEKYPAPDLSGEMFFGKSPKNK